MQGVCRVLIYVQQTHGSINNKDIIHHKFNEGAMTCLCQKQIAFNLIFIRQTMERQNGHDLLFDRHFLRMNGQNFFFHLNVLCLVRKTTKKHEACRFRNQRLKRRTDEIRFFFHQNLHRHAITDHDDAFCIEHHHGIMVVLEDFFENGKRMCRNGKRFFHRDQTCSTPFFFNRESQKTETIRTSKAMSVV